MEIEEENSQNSISSCQSTSSTQDSTKKIYNHLFSLNSDEEYWAFLRNRMPRTHGLNSHSRTYCKVDKTVAKHPTNRFPILSFSYFYDVIITMLSLGVSDMSGHYHPVYFALVSQENGDTFEWFFGSLIYLYSLFGVDFRIYPKVFMMDASDATYNAVRKCFPDAKILMCFFHVKFNCKKMYSKKGLKIADWKIVDADINILHETLSQDEFNIKWDKIEKKWQELGYTNWLAYFKQEWMNTSEPEKARWNNWQMFQVGPGRPSTNNAIESFHRVIKTVWTKHDKRIFSYLFY
jgi:hypothetical protein